jgi:ABC-2 type transport system permease protein
MTESSVRLDPPTVATALLAVPETRTPTAARAVLGMLARDVRVLRKDFIGFVARTAVQPLLMTFVFAVVLPVIGSAVGTSTTFASVLMPGLIASTAMLNGVTGVTMGLLNELNYAKEIEDRALTPASIRMIGLEKVLFGAGQSLLCGFVVVPLVLLVHAPGQAPHVTVADPLLLVVCAVLVPVLAASVGLLLGTVLDGHKFNVLISFVVVPATMLGCVYFPWAALQPLPWLQVAVLVNPVVYASEGLRACFTPDVAHMPVPVVLGVMVAAIAVTITWGLRCFERRVIK